MKKIESKNMIANDIRISQKLENKCLLSIEKDILKCKKKITARLLKKFTTSSYKSRC